MLFRSAGAVEFGLLTALPSRIIGLLETDLLQALPLYVFMGALLNRLPLADRLFRCGVALGGKSGGAPALATLGLGALLAPMNGSVGASVAMLSRSIAPKLEARGVPASESTALVCVSSTLGVVIPPSLVLILLGDAMMRAHTEATNVTRQMVRIVNTQDIFRGALVPAAMFLALCLAVAWWLGRRKPPQAAVEKPGAAEWATAAISAVFVIGLLAAGLWMVDLPFSLLKLQVYAWHKWLGLTVLLLTLVRLAWRWRSPPPELPSTVMRWERRVAPYFHRALLCLLLAQPVIGWLMSSAGGVTVFWFGVVPLPDLVPRNQSLFAALRTAHALLAWALIVLITIHMLAVVRHDILRRDGIFRRMWF